MRRESRDGTISTVHRRLLEVVTEVEGKVILGGYPSELHEAVLLAPRWHRDESDLPIRAAGGSTRRRETECLWTDSVSRGL
jgi:DNA adenine methylase